MSGNNNNNLISPSNLSTVNYRNPPAPPSPQLSANMSMPPQPPVRTNNLRNSMNTNRLPKNPSQDKNDEDTAKSNASSLSTDTKNNKKSSSPSPPPPMPPNRQINSIHNETATNVATKLVYKSVMTGSVQSLNQHTNSATNLVQSNYSNSHENSNVDNTQQVTNITQQIKNLNANPPHMSPPISSKSTTYHQHANIKEIAGVVVSSTSKSSPDSLIPHTLINNMTRESASSQTHPTPPSLSIRSLINPSKSNINSKSNNQLPWLLLNGEFIVKKEDDQTSNDQLNSSTSIVFVLPDNRGVRGRLYITNFRLYFRSNDEHYNSLIIDLPLGFINRVEKIGHQSVKQTNLYGLLISCKNGRRLRFACNNPHNAQQETSTTNSTRKELYELIQRYAFPISNQRNYFAFAYKPPNNTYADNSGWFLYDAKQEYERMGISKSSDWRFSNINQAFKFCDTYPKVLVVPYSVSDDDLKQIGEYRSKHRIPVVSWLKFDSRKNHVALLRSSQPLVGLTQKRSDKDESYLSTIYKLNTINSLDKIFIMDARPMVNAVANRTTGGGYENEDNYRDCELHFLNIQNIHVMRESLRKIFDMGMPSSTNYQHIQTNSSSNGGSNSVASVSTTSSGTLSNHQLKINHGANNVNNNGANNSSSNNPNSTSNSLGDDKNFFVNLENSKWLEHIRSLLNGSLKIVKYIHDNNSSVLVHCSDGWDRTSQLTSLSMLMMDKYYRTLKGFQVLVEKEWISFGHRFGIRMGHGSDKHSDQDRSPIFLQFIDAVWQIMQQNSKVFEFNEKFLLTILNNMYTCQFGTFLYNNEAEREKNEVRLKTYSLWSYINSYKNEFKNSAYIEHDGVVECSTALSSLQLWTSYYFQYKEIIDDSQNEVTINSAVSAFNANYVINGLNSQDIAYTINPPLQSKLFGPAFFQQVVSQMKASVRNYSTQEPELVKYRASFQPADT